VPVMVMNTDIAELLKLVGAMNFKFWKYIIFL